jgi:hypothetical protein
MTVRTFNRICWRKNTLAAVESRVRRALRREGEVLRKTRPGNTWAKVDFGDYFTVDPHTGNPERRHVNLEQLARDLDVLHADEVIEE